MIKEMAQKAHASRFAMAIASTEQKNRALFSLMQNLQELRSDILEANQKDIDAAVANQLSAALIDRLSLQNRLDGVIQDVDQVIRLPDPIGEKFDEYTLENHLHVAKCRTPIGVLGIIYESRPNVTIDISSLAIKSGNSAILRGGSETLHTNQVLVKAIQKALHAAGLPSDAIQLITSSDRAQVKEMLHLHEYIDLIIPRGSSALQQFCRDNSTIPVIFGGVGICHLFVDETAELHHSLEVIINAKMQRPAACNSLDTLLVHQHVAPLFVPKLVEVMRKMGVRFKLDPRAYKLLQDHTACELAQGNDWDTEWMSLVLGIKIVDNLKEAVDHIHRHSMGHSDGILTEDKHHAELFVNQVDSAAVYVNASTRFTDGGQFGLGAEVAVSTQKLHARGPMGLKELTSYKWVVHGNYQVRK